MSTDQALALKVWDWTGSVTGPGLSSREDKQHHISVALCSGVFLLLNCCIFAANEALWAFFFAIFQLQTSGRTGHSAGIQHCKTKGSPRAASHTACCRLSAHCYHENHGYIRNFPFPGLPGPQFCTSSVGEK